MRPDAERLTDIIEAAEKIAARVGKGREAFDSDEDMQIVLVHLIQVIGEAATGLSDDMIAAHPEVPWRQIIATRHRVVHGYFGSISTSSGMSPSSMCLTWLIRSGTYSMI